MNLLPVQYPNVWLEEDREWFTLGELPYQAPAVYYAFIDFKWDENIAVVFLKPNKDSKTNPFSICLVEFLTYDKNIYIESIQTLGYAEDSVVEQLIAQREDEENQQREAEERLEAEQAERAAEDARLRELYPLPEDEQEYGDMQYEGFNAAVNDQLENTDENEILSKEEKIL